MAEVVKTSRAAHLLSDEPDNRILECAEKAGAHVLVTGDKHLLKLTSYKDAKIVRLADFVSLIEKGSKESSL